MNKRTIAHSFISLWISAFCSCAFAQSLSTPEWEEWNTVTSSIFPKESWMQYESPEEAGWSSEKLSSAQHWINEGESAAVIVIYNGAILAQWGQTERRFKCHSIRKSLLSGLYGNAVQNGTIDLGETIGSIGIDDDVPLTETEKMARVSDLLKSRSGVYLPAAYETGGMADSRPKRGSHNSGTHWHYNNWGFNALSTIYNKKTSNDLFEAFETQIAIPTKMQDFELRHTYYHLEAEKSRHPAYPFRMSARDLARFGLLFLNEGRWQDQQVIPAGWVRESTKMHSSLPAGGYGYMWWTARERSQLGILDSFWAAGRGGHRVYIVPGARLVLVHRADTYANKEVNPIYIQAILREVLKARTGPPRRNPNLIRLDDKQTDEREHDLSSEQIFRLTGEYEDTRVSVVVDKYQGRLQITNPYSGRFYLLPVSDTEFVVEDEQYPGEFVLDETGAAKAIRIWGDRDEPFEMHRFTRE